MIEEHNEGKDTIPEEKYIDPEMFNDDIEESLEMERVALELKPYFSLNMVPRSIYLQKTVLPLVYEALAQVERMRPKDPIEFFVAYLLDKNKKEI